MKKAEKPKTRTEDADGWMEGTVFVRYTDKHGAMHYEEHRCWHTERFLKRVARDALKEGGKAEQVSEATFKAWKLLNRRHR